MFIRILFYASLFFILTSEKAVSLTACPEAFSLKPIFIRPIESLWFSHRLQKRLTDEGIKHIGDLVTKSETEIFNLSNIGEDSILQIKDALARKGLYVGMRVNNWPPSQKQIEELRQKLNEEEATLQPPTDPMPFLVQPIEILDLNIHILKRLKNSQGFEFVGDLVVYSEKELLRLPDFKNKSLDEIKEALAKMNLRLGMEVKNWPPENYEDLRTSSEELIKKFQEEQKPSIPLIPLLMRPIHDLEISNHLQRKLIAQGIHDIGDLITKASDDISVPKKLTHQGRLDIDGLTIGNPFEMDPIKRNPYVIKRLIASSLVHLIEIRYALAKMGLQLGMKVENWPPSPEQRKALTQRLKTEETPQPSVALIASFIRSIYSLDLPNHIRASLIQEGILYLGDLVNKTEAELLKTPGIDKISLTEIKKMLLSMDLQLGMKVENWPPSPKQIEELRQKLRDEEAASHLTTDPMPSLVQSIDKLAIPEHIQNYLIRAEIQYIGDLVTKTERELLSVKGIGKKSLNSIQHALRKIGLRLKLRVENWPDLRETLKMQEENLRPLVTLTPTLIRPIDFLGLSAYIQYILISEGINYIGDLITKTKQDLIKTGKFNKTDYPNIEYALSKMDLQLGMKVENWPLSPEQKEMLIQKLKAEEVLQPSTNINFLLLRPISSLELSPDIETKLTDKGIRYIGDLVQKEERMFLAERPDHFLDPLFDDPREYRRKFYNKEHAIYVPEKAVIDIRQALAKIGLRLGRKVENWPPEKIKAENQVPISTLTTPIDYLDLSNTTFLVLRVHNDTIFVGELIQYTKTALLKTPDFGKKKLEEVKEALAKMNLRLGMEVKNWPPENYEDLRQEYQSERKRADVFRLPPKPPKD